MMKQERAMVIVAHPDDAEYLAAGLVSLRPRGGIEVAYAIVTNGNKGIEDPLRPAIVTTRARTSPTISSKTRSFQKVVVGSAPDGGPARRGIADVVDAVNFAQAHDLRVVVSKLEPSRGVPFYWRFVPAGR